MLSQVLLDYEKEPEKVNLRDEQYLKKTADRMPDIGKKVRARMHPSFVFPPSPLLLASQEGQTKTHDMTAGIIKAKVSSMQSMCVCLGLGLQNEDINCVLADGKLKLSRLPFMSYEASSACLETAYWAPKTKLSHACQTTKQATELSQSPKHATCQIQYCVVITDECGVSGLRWSTS